MNPNDQGTGSCRSTIRKQNIGLKNYRTLFDYYLLWRKGWLIRLWTLQNHTETNAWLLYASDESQGNPRFYGLCLKKIRKEEDLV